MKFNQKFTLLGMAHCKEDPSFVFVSLKFERLCASFQAAPASTVLTRENWAKAI
jgi:hypothetical protein